MSDLEKALTETQAYEELRAAHNRALRALSKRDNDQAELVDAVYRAAKDAALGMKIPSVPTPKPSGKKGVAETLVISLGDWQLGKNSETYNIEVAKQRIDLLAQKVARLIELHGVPVNEIQCALLGDFVESDGNIFPSQAYEVEQGGLYVQIFEGASMLAQFVRAMAALAPKVTVRGASGNHGRNLRRPVGRSSRTRATSQSPQRMLRQGQPGGAGRRVPPRASSTRSRQTIRMPLSTSCRRDSADSGPPITAASSPATSERACESRWRSD